MLSPDHRAGPRSVRTPTATARGGAQRPADTRCCRRPAPDSVTATPASWEVLGRCTHLGGGPHRPLAPVGQPRHAGLGQPLPLPLRVNRTGRTTPGTASSSRPTAARHPDRCRCRGRQPALRTSRTRYRSCPTPSTSPARQVWVRPLKHNLSDPRCSAQHSPLPHRVPHGRSPFTVAPVNRTPAGLPEAQDRPDTPPPAERFPPEVALPSVGSPSGPLRHSVVSSRTPGTTRDRLAAPAGGAKRSVATAMMTRRNDAAS